MSHQRRLEIYIGYNSPSIIRYLKPLTGDVFTTKFFGYHFYQTFFPKLGRKYKPHKKELT
jgi:hypothetical protein